VTEKNESKHTGKISRREFLKGAEVIAGAVGSAALLNACSSPNATVTNTFTETSTKTAPALPPSTITMPAVTTTVASKYSFETPPKPITDDEISKTVNSEVIVIGAGTAGLVCATAASESGAKVVVIAKSNTPVSRGGSNFAFNSRTTRQAGISLDISKVYKELMLASSYRINQDKWWLFAHKSGEAMDWVCDRMEAAGYKTVLNANYVDPDDINNAYPGEHGWVGDDIAMGTMGQTLLVNLFARNLQSAGTQIDYKVTALQLVRENSNTGRVTAVIAQDRDGNYIKYVGSKAVVLATGDFGTDKEMVAKYCSWAVPVTGGVYGGDGHKMALWIGAAWQKNVPNAPMISMPPGVGAPPVTGINHLGLMVNKNGVRFGNEDNILSNAALAQMNQPEMKAFAIWNLRYAERAAPWPGDTYGASPKPPEAVIAGWDMWASMAAGGPPGGPPSGPGPSGPPPGGGSPSPGRVGSGGPPMLAGMPSVVTVKTDTIEELAQKFGLPFDALKATIDRYNSFCQSGIDEDYGKRKALLLPIDDSPYYGSSSVPWMLIMTGGLRTNTELQVLDANDQVIPGLYAVGTISGDMFSNNYTFMLPGHNLGANCITFGYLAGKSIAKR